MPSITVGKLTFHFPSKWEASKFDDWAFYRRQFQKLGNIWIDCNNCNKQLECKKCGRSRTAGVDAVDILAIEPGVCCWQIEVKDYRQSPTKAVDLADKFASKVRDSLACLVAARIHATGTEQTQAIAALKCGQLRVVLHLEEPGSPRSSFLRQFSGAI